MYISSREIREMFLNRWKWCRGFARIEVTAQLDGLLNVGLVEAPQLQRMIHAAGHNAIAT